MNDHSGCVRAWLEHQRSPRPAGLVRAFDRALVRLWARAHRTLSDVTLMAILERVHSVATERYPILAALELGPGGPSCAKLHEPERLAADDHEQLEEAIRFFLIELLTVLGNLTGDILTPSLHAELSLGETLNPDGEDLEP
jgi:hypothetical protein